MRPAGHGGEDVMEKNMRTWMDAMHKQLEDLLNGTNGSNDKPTNCSTTNGRVPPAYVKA